MSGDLVTVAVFGTPTEAAMAQNLLESEGIAAFVNDESVPGMFWHLGNAVGGVKLQVPAGDEERAATVLESVGETGHGSELSTEEWDDPDGHAAEESEPSEDGGSVSVADETVARAFRAAGVGLAILPVQFYSLWLLVSLDNDESQLSASGRRMVWLTLLLDLPVLLVSALLLWLILRD